MCCDNANVSICAQERFETDDVSLPRAKFLNAWADTVEQQQSGPGWFASDKTLASRLTIREEMAQNGIPDCIGCSAPFYAWNDMRPTIGHSPIASPLV